jgi:hypothetical protein
MGKIRGWETARSAAIIFPSPFAMFNSPEGGVEFA